MNESRRTMYKNNPVKNKDLKIDVNFDITMLDLMCAFVVSSNKNIRRGNIINMRNLFAVVNMDNYANDTERLSRINFISKGIEARLEHSLTDRDMILHHIAGGLGCEIDDCFKELNNDEVAWINKTISQILKDSIIYNDVDRGLALFTKFKSTEYANRGPIVKEIEQFVNDLQVKFRRARADDSSNMEFRLTGDDYESSMRETHRQLSSPSNKLRFGTQALNILTGGGVEAQRVYTLLGLPGEGKSTTLIDMAIEIKRYNKDYVCNDPTKKPCVVLLVMENSIKETIQRIFSMCVGVDMLNYSEDEAMEILKTQGNLHVSTDDPIDLIVKYKPNLSVDSSYLYTMVEDLEDEGFETICVLQDYLKRIRSVDGSFGGDLRLQLGAIINEFKIFATLKNIPVITASQLNRDATAHIDEARGKNKADLVRLLGRSNVGESNLILENSDWIALIAPEYDRDGNKYLGIQRVKSRYYIAGDMYTAFIPYINGTVKFIEDFYSQVPVHKTTLRAEMDNGINNNNQGIINDIKEFTEVDNIKLPTDNGMNMFMNATAMVAYNMALQQRFTQSQKVIVCKRVAG